jgi:hypothetical protein
MVMATTSFCEQLSLNNGDIKDLKQQKPHNLSSLIVITKETKKKMIPGTLGYCFITKPFPLYNVFALAT